MGIVRTDTSVILCVCVCMYVNNRHNELIFCYLMSVYGDSWGICVKLSKVYLPVEYFTDSCRSVAKLCPTLCDPINCSMPGFPVLQTPFKLPEFAQTQVHWINDAIQPSHPLLPSSPLALSFS